jgi:phosphoadenosine phosphosulfate reductase
MATHDLQQPVKLYKPRAVRKRSSNGAAVTKAPRRNKHVRPHPLDVTQRFANLYRPDGLLISLSGGKDSVCALAVCRRLFPNARIIAYFMYLVKGLSFQENYLAYLQRRFRIESILTFPYAPFLVKYFRHSRFRHPTAESAHVRNISFHDIDVYVRRKTGLHWIANGERACESVQRNAMLRHCDGIDEKRGRVFPLTYWNDSMVWQYLRHEHVALAPEYGAMGLKTSFTNLRGEQLEAIRRCYPDDFRKIERVFPLCRLTVDRWESEHASTSGSTNSNRQGWPTI